MIELHEVTDTGGLGEVLPDWSNLTFSQDMVAGALTFDYPRQGRNFDKLGHGRTIAVRIDDLEPDNGRFTFDEESGSRIAESEGGKISLGCTSNLGRFDQLKLGPAVGSQFADENLFNYLDKTPGWLASTAIDNGMSRAVARNAAPSWFTHPLTKFSATHDSAGVAWPTTYDTRFTSGQSVTEVLEWLVTNGFAEPVMRGKDLYLYTPEKRGRDLSTGSSPVVLQAGADFTEASFQASSRELITALLVLGEENSCTWVFDTAAIAEHGYREGTLNVGNASTQATLTAAGQAYLRTRNRVRNSYTYAVGALYLETRPDKFNPRPFVDFQVGDTILLLDGYETLSSRVRLMSATWPSAQASTIALTVNDWFAEQDLIFEQRLSRLGG